MSEKNNPEGEIIIDLESALERTGDDMEFLKELLEMFMEDFNPKCQELEEAIQAKNFTGIKEIGHYLKGSSANLSLMQLREAAYQMEVSGKDENLEKAKSTLEVLRKEFARLEEYFPSMD
jgi:HPt (histidine-containing phosphotransfer) domain-containing protein